MRYPRILAAGAAAVVTVFAVVAVTRPAEAATLLSDTFESYSSFPAGSWVDDTESDSWAIATDGSKVARQTSTASDTYIVVNGQSGWSNYTVAADVKVGSTSVRNGVVARFSSSNNYYFLLLHNGRLLLNRKVAGSTSTIQSVAFPFTTSRFYRLSLSVSGTSLKGYVDGALLVQGSDSALTSGRVGLYANGVASYDNVSVTDAAGPGPTQTPSPTAPPTGTPTPPPTTPPPTTPPPGPGRTVNVANSAQLTAAMNAAIAGDTIVLANGNYTIGKLNAKHGTASSPITVRAASTGGAVINGGQLEVASSSYATFEGLRWTNSNTLKLTSSHHIRLTRNHFRLTESSSLKWIIIQGANSHHNRIDHNLFEEKHQLGNFITVDGSETQQSQYDLIDHNHFRNIGPRATNEMEAIRVGWSEISRSNGFTTIEYNLFENADGDPEIISVKSNDNVVRYNTFRTSQGTLSARHGNRSHFYGNFFLGGGKAGTGGIRVYGQDHRIYNNYFEGLTGTGYDAAIQLDGGDVDTSGALSSHWRVYRAVVVNNTFVGNVGNVEVGRNYSLAPVDCVIANNVVVGSSGPLFAEFKTPVRLTYAGNIAWPTGSATVGVSQPASAIRVVDPALTTVNGLRKLSPGSPAVNASVGDHPYVTDDMDGQPRSGVRDVGADEYSTGTVTRRPLNATDVGIGGP